MRFSCLTLCFFLFLTVCLSTVVKFHVFSPDELSHHYKYQQLDISVANYGYIPYGQSLIGNLYYSNPRNACLPLSNIAMNLTDPSPIIVIERGACHFVTKSHYAQLFGAKMAIILDNEVEKEESVLMIDDGYGFDIHIPTIMLSKADGDMLAKFMPNQTVSISFEFVLEKRENYVSIEFWMSSYDATSYEFLKKFRDFSSKLKGDISSFVPHYALWFCPACKDTNYTLSTENCLSNGRYCLPDGESKNLKNVLGREVVYEDLTQLCLFTLDQQKWWDYIEGFYNYCFVNKEANLSLKQCSEYVYTRNQYDKVKVEMCINDSFIDRNLTNLHDGENILLNQEQKSFIREGVQSWPTLRINNETFRGSLNPVKGAITAICEQLTTPNEACKQNINKNKGATVQQDEGGVSTTTFVIVSVVVIIALALAVLFIYQRKIRKEMAFDLQNQVNSHLSKYFSLGGEKKEVVQAV